MRIALVVHKFPPASLGGTEVYTQSLAEAMAARHDVFVFYRHDSDGQTSCEEWQERGGYRAWRVGCAFDAKSASLAGLFFDYFLNPDIEQSFKRFLAEARPDVVHFQHLMSLSYRLIAIAQSMGIPSLLTLHDYWFICANSQLVWPDMQSCRGKALGLNCVRCAMSRVSRPMMKVLYPAIAPVLQTRDFLVQQAALKARLLIAPSRFSIDRHVAAGFPPRRFRWVENGIDVERIRSFPRRSSDNARLRIAYLGSLAWQKGVHILVQAVHALPPERVRVRVFGDYCAFPDYVARLERMANPAHTTFEGVLPHDLVGRALAETDVLIVPSLWYENSPMVIQEAFAARVPVVAARLGALGEKVCHGVNGLLVSPGDARALQKALERLLNEVGLLERLQEGIPPVTTIQEHARRVESIYRWAAGQQGDPALC